MFVCVYVCARARCAQAFGDEGAKCRQELDADGLPRPGGRMEQGSAEYSVTDRNAGSSKAHAFKSVDPAMVEQARLSSVALA